MSFGSYFDSTAMMMIGTGYLGFRLRVSSDAESAIGEDIFGLRGIINPNDGGCLACLPWFAKDLR